MSECFAIRERFIWRAVHVTAARAKDLRTKGHRLCRQIQVSHVERMGWLYGLGFL